MRHGVIGVIAGIAIAVWGALLAAGMPVHAEDDVKKDKAQWRVEKLTKVLELTPEQQGQVQQIADDYQTRRKAIKDQLEALRLEEDGKVKALLTPEQQAKFEQWQQRKAEQRKERMERRKDKKGRDHGHEHDAPDAGEGQ